MKGGEAWIAVERNNHGSGVLAYLNATEHYTNLWSQGGERGGNHPGDRAGEAGFLTTAGNKPGMVSRVGALLVETPQIFSSKRLLAECRTFVNHLGSRTGAANGAHDDCLMAMAIAQAVRAEWLTQHR